MDTHSIPHSLNQIKDEPISLFDYRSTEECGRQHVTLTQNAFSFLIDGKKEVITNNTALSIENTNFLFMKSGHCLMTEKTSDSNKVYRSLLLFFSDDILIAFIKKHDVLLNKAPLPQSAYTFIYDGYTTQFVKSLLEVYKLPQPIQRKLIETKLEEILLFLVASHGVDFLHSILNKNNQNKSFTTVVEHNILNKLSLKELAFLSNMSVSSFKRMFEKHYGISPIKWFQDKRLDHATYLLKQEQKRASEIYLEIGYENLSSFIQAYKAKFGVTPKQHQST